MTTKRLVGMFAFPSSIAAGWIMHPLLPHAPTICLWKRWFGWECPTCGLTRAFCLFARGEFAAAAALTPLVFPLYGLILSISAISLLRWLQERRRRLCVTSRT
jgi:hypothetical protein